MDLTIEQCRVSGQVIASGVIFDLPLMSQIGENLWIGGCVDGIRLPDDFEFVISLHPEIAYEIGESTNRMEIEVWDDPSVPVPEEDFALAAEAVVDSMRMGKTLLHCEMGLNRSALVAVMALVMCGMPNREAIRLIRSKRGEVCLENPTFAAFAETWIPTVVKA